MAMPETAAAAAAHSGRPRAKRTAPAGTRAAPRSPWSRAWLLVVDGAAVLRGGNIGGSAVQLVYQAQATHASSCPSAATQGHQSVPPRRHVPPCRACVRAPRAAHTAAGIRKMQPRVPSATEYRALKRRLHAHNLLQHKGFQQRSASSSSPPEPAAAACTARDVALKTICSEPRRS